MTRTTLFGTLMVLVLGLSSLAWAGPSSSDKPAEEPETKMSQGLSTGAGLALLGAGVALGLGALGTGVAQSRIGSAGLGLIAEDPKKLGIVLVFIAIPETLLIFGFLIAIMLMGKA